LKIKLFFYSRSSIYILLKHKAFYYSERNFLSPMHSLQKWLGEDFVRWKQTLALSQNIFISWQGSAKLYSKSWCITMAQ